MTMATEPRGLKPRYQTKANEQPKDAPSDPMADQEMQRRLRGVLEWRVNTRIREAQQARESSGIEEIWAEDEDQYNGIDPNTAAASIVKTRDQMPRRGKPGNRSKVFLNITKPKTDTGVARVQEMLVPHDDKPWDTSRTPVPDIDAAIARNDKTLVTLGDGTSQTPDGQPLTASMVAEMLNAKADELAKKEADWIEDKFDEGSVYAELRKVIRNAGRIGSGVIKGPIPVLRKSKKWGLDETSRTMVLSMAEKLEPTSKCIRAQDFYPAPECGDNIHNGSYCVERDYLTARGLRGLAELPDYDQEAILAALEEGPRMKGRTRNDMRRDIPGDTFSDAELFEVFYYHGDMTPDDMILLGLDQGMEEGQSNLTEKDWRLQSVPAVVTMLNGRCIRCTLNPSEAGEFPYDVFPWEPVDGQPWGRGIPRKMGVAQRGLNAAVRAWLENAGLSSGPLVAIMNGAMKPVDGVYEITGRKLFTFDPTDLVDDIQKAIATFDIPSHTKDLLEMVRFWLEMADVLTNLPALLQGMQAVGTSPETLGGMQMLLNNSTAPLRVTAKQFDDYLVVPHLRRYHDWYMQDPDIPIKDKGDTQISARGATALVQRAEGIEFLAMLYPVKDDPKLKIDPSKLLLEMARGRGFNLSTIQYTEDEWKAEQARMAQNPPPPDPRVRAAELRNEGLQIQAQSRAAEGEAERQFKREEAAADRAVQQMVASVEAQLEQMREAGKQELSLAQIKAMLAKSSMDNRLKTDEMALKLAPANTSGTGI